MKPWQNSVRLRPARRGSILVGLLWCLALLSVVVVGVLHSSRMDLQVSKHLGDTIQARYLALAAIEKAKALIHEDAKDRERSGRHHTGVLFNAPQHFRDVTLGRGTFSVVRQAGQDESPGLVYGISDEESRLNVNVAQSDELGKLRGMTPDVVAAIVDWRDDDNTVTAGGAEADYYAGRRPPAKPRNGPFETIRELLMVRDLPRELFLGEDANQNGLMDTSENDGGASAPVDNRDGVLDSGWAGLLTTDSGVTARSASGQSRTDIRSADEAELSRVRGISSEIAQAIVAYRGQGQFENILDLLEVTAPPPPGSGGPRPTAPAPGPGPGRGGASGRGGQNRAASGDATSRQSGGPKLISQDLLVEIADELTASDDDQQAGALNINTASSEVLELLPGVTREMAQAVVGHRKSAGYFPTVASLLKVDGFSPDVLKKLWPRLAVRSETFRIVGEGRVAGSNARQRIEMIVRLNQSRFETLSYREDL